MKEIPLVANVLKAAELLSTLLRPNDKKNAKVMSQNARELTTLKEVEAAADDLVEFALGKIGEYTEQKEVPESPEKLTAAKNAVRSAKESLRFARRRPNSFYS